MIINNTLVDKTLKSIRKSPYVKRLARMILRERQAGDTHRKPTDAEKKDAIIRSYLAPISVHLRALFSQKLSEQMDETRLRRLTITYQQTIKLLAFILLSDIWDFCSEEHSLQLDEKEKLHLQAFFNLNAHSATAFDYFQFSDALLKVASRNQIPFFLKGFNQYRGGWSQYPKLIKADRHFKMMQATIESDVPSRQIKPYCLASEERLMDVLCEFNFMTQYKMAVVKNIEVQQIKHLPPRTYQHVMVELDNNYNDVGRKDRHQHLDHPTDMESVLLYKEKLNENLNLSPFILDENALIREFNSKIYFFSHIEGECLNYYWIENPKDTLKISKPHYSYIKRQFDKAKQEILNEKENIVADADLSADDDILSFM